MIDLETTLPSYRGIPDPEGGVEVLTPAGRALPFRIDLAPYAASFAWGCASTRPAVQLALALLAHAVGPVRALGVHRAFAREVVARLPAGRPWALSRGEVMAAAMALEAAEEGRTGLLEAIRRLLDGRAAEV